MIFWWLESEDFFNYCFLYIFVFMDLSSNNFCSFFSPVKLRIVKWNFGLSKMGKYFLRWQLSENGRKTPPDIAANGTDFFAVTNLAIFVANDECQCPLAFSAYLFNNGAKIIKLWTKKYIHDRRYVWYRWHSWHNGQVAKFADFQNAPKVPILVLVWMVL